MAPGRGTLRARGTDPIRERTTAGPWRRRSELGLRGPAPKAALSAAPAGEPARRGAGRARAVPLCPRRSGPLTGAPAAVGPRVPGPGQNRTVLQLRTKWTKPREPLSHPTTSASRHPYDVHFWSPPTSSFSPTVDTSPWSRAEDAREGRADGERGTSEDGPRSWATSGTGTAGARPDRH